MTEPTTDFTDPNPSNMPAADLEIPSLVDVPDLTVLPEDKYRLQIIGAKSAVSKGNPAEGKLPRPFINLVCKVLGYDNAKNVFHKLWFPLEGDDLEKRGTMLRMMKEFVKACNLPVDQKIPAASFIGCEFNCILNQTEFGGEVRNEVKRLI